MFTLPVKTDKLLTPPAHVYRSYPLLFLRTVLLIIGLMLSATMIPLVSVFLITVLLIVELDDNATAEV